MLSVAGPAAAGADVDPELERQLDGVRSTATAGAFVHFADGGYEAGARLLKARGIEVGADFPQVDVAWAYGPAAAIRALREEGAVRYLEANRELAHHGDTDHWATLAGVAAEKAGGGPYRDVGGRPLTGEGVGVAVVDSGINASHPDLTGRVVDNVKIVCSTPLLINTQTRMCFGPRFYIGATDTDTSSGHGTHVAGIVAGGGNASRGTFRGQAPGAKLFGLGTGETVLVLYAAEAFQYIIDNYDDLKPRIRVVTNSWGEPDGATYDPGAPTPPIEYKLTQALVDKGVTVLYAAGNAAGDGDDDFTSSYNDYPIPGVIGVASYDDHGRGSRTGDVSDFSSRGKSGASATYPDISAPGTAIVSTCLQEVQPVCNFELSTSAWRPWYASVSGTSMATPHVAAAAALLYQARPELTPAQVEDILLDTAHPFTFGASYEADPQNAGGRTSYDKGAGLLDVQAALERLGAANDGLPPAGAPQEVVTDRTNDSQGPDIAALTATPIAEGVRYVVSLNRERSLPTFNLHLDQIVVGERFSVGVRVDPTGATRIAGHDARDFAVDTVDRTVAFTVPFEALNDPPHGAVAHSVVVRATNGLWRDIAPGDELTDAGDFAGWFVAGPEPTRPEFGSPYTIVRGTKTELTAADATVAHSDEAELSATLRDSGGAVLVGEAVTFEVGQRTLTAETAADGVATVRFAATESAGEHPVRVSYRGRSSLVGSSATATLTVVTEQTALVLAQSDAGGDFSDLATVRARVIDDDGTPLAAAPVRLELAGASGTAITDADGVAVAQFRLTERPGAHTVTAAYAGSEGRFAPAAGERAFTIAREAVGMELALVGTGNDRALRARLADSDTPSSGVAERTIAFYGDGQLIGYYVTNADGVARLALPPRLRGGRHAFEARFAGDDWYSPGSAMAANG